MGAYLSLGWSTCALCEGGRRADEEGIAIWVYFCTAPPLSVRLVSPKTTRFPVNSTAVEGEFTARRAWPNVEAVPCQIWAECSLIRKTNAHALLLQGVVPNLYPVTARRIGSQKRLWVFLSPNRIVNSLLILQGYRRWRHGSPTGPSSSTVSIFLH